MTRTTPLRLITLQLRQIRLTEASTFMMPSTFLSFHYLARNTIRPLVKSYGVNSTVTLSPGRMRM